jgi:hypothetical protein
MSFRICVAIASIAFVGCATHLVAARPLPGEEEAKVNGIVGGRKATLTVEGKPRQLDIKDLRLAVTRAYFQERDPGSSLFRTRWLPEDSVPLGAVQRVEFRDQRRGALHGLGFGALGGAIAGAVAGLAIPWGGTALCERGDCTGKMLPLTTVGGALVFALIGVGVGAATGARTTVEFNDAAAR